MKMNVKFAESDQAFSPSFGETHVIRTGGSAIPDKLPNPYPLTLTGAVQTEYDGSKPVQVEIPKPKDNGIAVSGASVGQTIRIAEVDAEGKPTAWEAVAFPTGGGGLSAELMWECTTDGETYMFASSEVEFTDGMYAITVNSNGLEGTGTRLQGGIGGLQTAAREFVRGVDFTPQVGPYNANAVRTVFVIQQGTYFVLSAESNNHVSAAYGTIDFYKTVATPVKGVCFGGQSYTNNIAPAGMIFRVWRLF